MTREPRAYTLLRDPLTIFGIAAHYFKGERRAKYFNLVVVYADLPPCWVGFHIQCTRSEE